MLAAFGVDLIGVVAAGVPRPALNLHHGAVHAGELPVQLKPHLAAKLLAGRVTHQNEAMNQPRFLAWTKRPDAALETVVLSIDAAHEY
ncbi:hypothetical protein D3C76_1740890 [compost metagenome]